MKTKKSILLMCALAAVCLSSCDKNDTTVPANDGAVRFTSGITATPGTRATIDTDGNSLWEKGDPVGIYMLTHDTYTVTGGAGNVPYTADMAGAATAFTATGADIYYPMDDAARVDFLAYHPYNAAVAGFDYPVNLAQQTPQTAIDLMTAHADKQGAGYAKADGAAGTAVDFAFAHRLVKLVMNVTTDASVRGTIASVSIKGMNTTASFDLTTGTLSAAANITDITPCTVTDQTRYEAILLPVGALAATHTVTFTTTEGECYTWAMSKQIASLDAGTIYTYDVNVTRHAVTATGSIDKWKVGSTGTGTAE